MIVHRIGIVPCYAYFAMRITPSLLLLSSVLVLSACGSEPAATSETGASVEVEGEMAMSMKDLVKLGKNYACTFDDTDEQGMRTAGTVYVQGETNFRGDFVMTEKGGKKYASHMITANKTSYMWSDEDSQGMMIKLDDDDDVFADAEIESEDDEDISFDEDEEMKMNCKKWSPSGSTFMPPKNIEFVDFAAQMEGMMKMQGGDSSQCGVCDMAGTEQEKAECRKALGC